MEQTLISALICVLSLVCGIIGSTELYLKINEQMEQELISSKDYYLLGVEIYKMLQLDDKNRQTELKVFLDEKFQIYTKLIETSCVIRNKIVDKLAPINTPTQQIIATPSSSDISSSTEPFNNV